MRRFTRRNPWCDPRRPLSLSRRKASRACAYHCVLLQRALALEATPEELTWLKMREYYATQRAAAADGAASTSAPGAGDAASAAADNDVAALRAEMLRVAMEALGSATETEELEARARSHLAASSAGRQWSRGVAGGAGAAASGEASAAVLAAAADAAVASVMVGTGARYRDDYLEEERLTRQVAKQRGQRSQAFALSLAAAVGVSVARWWLRRGRGGAGAGGGSGGPSRSRSTQQMQ